jgi:hypothetical protein
MPKIAAVRRVLLAGGIVTVIGAIKVALLGIGAGTFNNATVVPVLLVVGAALILAGLPKWPPWRRSTNREDGPADGLSEGIDTEDEPL